jgi:hypothetical protein
VTAHNDSTQRPSPGRVRLTDSPWFWLLVFANAGLVGVVVIGPKYNQRQGAVERRYEARREVARRAQEEETNTTAAEDNTSNETAPDENSSREASAHIVPLKPLALTLVIGNLLAIVLFAWNQVRLMKPAAENSHPPIQ